MTIRFIINPVSGKGSHSNIDELIYKHIDTSKFEVETIFTKHPKHATLLAKDAAKNKKDIVIAVGGDGTMHECALGLIGRKTALGVLPCGSGNGFAFHFNMNANLTKAIRQLNHCQFKTIDSCTANGMPFFNVSGVGFDAHIAHLFNNTKVRGFSSYIKLVLRECAFYPAQKYTIKYNGKKEELKALIISWANATQFGNNAVISPQSKIDDGMVDICILKDFNRIKVPLLLYRLFTNSIHRSKYMTIIRTKNMKIQCHSGISHLDGECIDLGKFIDIDTIPKSLNIFVPNE